jgi:hypothetical protein
MRVIDGSRTQALVEEVLMKFNSFLWQNFVESRQGQEWIAFFKTLGSRYEQGDEQLNRFVEQWSASGMMLERVTTAEKIEEVHAVRALLADGMQHEWLPSGPLTTLDDAEAYFRDGVASLYWTNQSGESAEMATEDFFRFFDIPALSIALYCLHPRFFFPYYFYPRFYALKQIFEEFGIFLPPVPSRKDEDCRFYYYFELCRSVHHFAAEHGVPGELIPVFLYGFAPQALQFDDAIPTELPSPRRAWFVGGGANQNGDFEYLDEVASSSQTIWQGNPDTQPGDIVVMYCLAPRSYVHSVWRALRFGAVEPFRSRYNTIWIGWPQLLTPITLNEMRKDPILSSMPLVRSSMQGLGGRVITKPYYDRLLALLQAKGVDTSALPQLEEVEIEDVNLGNERGVELHLLEPLLAEIGFQPSDWIRQLKLRVGRSEKAIPDYVILPAERREDYAPRAAWIWEAKFSIRSHEQLRKDFEQATSYARLVGAQGVSLLSREGLWLSLRQDDYALAKAKHWSMAQIRTPDNIADIRAISGRRKVTTTG